MPIYNYTCQKCGKFEGFQNIVDRETIECPQCGGLSNKDAEIEVNQFLAKTRYILPPLATRKQGDKHKTSHKRGKWV